MLKESMDILRAFPVRKSKAQKAAFRQEVTALAEGWGYAVSEEAVAFGARNLVMGDPEGAEFLVTAHYDTCARLPVPNLITPCNALPFLGYQLLLVGGILGISFLLGLAAALVSGVGFVGSVVDVLALWGMLLWMLVGPANPSNANDNTSGVVTMLEIARTLPQNQRQKVCFVLFDLEEAWLIGSSAYRKAHKQAVSRQLVLNLDCVGEGDHIRLFPTKALRKNPEKLAPLYRACGVFGKKNIRIREKGFAVYPSDQANFPYGVGICALKKSRFGLYLGRIHTRKDTVLDETNVNLLRAALTSVLCRSAAQ